MDTTFGIVTPSNSRRRFLARAVERTRRQTCDDWVFVYVNDGASASSRKLFERMIQGDPRMRYMETAARTGDWGWTPRTHATRHLLESADPPDYVVMWDDDDDIFPEALEMIGAELKRTEFPDLLVVPVLGLHDKVRPDPAIEMDDLVGGDLITINFVARLDVCAGGLECLPKGGRIRGRDYSFFDRLRKDPESRIEFGEMKPIGRIDGARPLMNLRRRLGPPELGIERIPLLRDIRWWLRG